MVPAAAGGQGTCAYGVPQRAGVYRPNARTGRALRETQLADLGTKPLPRQHLQELVALWRLKDSNRKVATLRAETAQAQLPQSTGF